MSLTPPLVLLAASSRTSVQQPSANPCFCAPSLLPLSHPSPLTPPAFSHIVQVHCAGIHLHHIYSQTHVHEAPEKTCGAGAEKSTAAGLSVWGRAAYHVHPNKGPVFRQTSRESSTALFHSTQPYYNACPEAHSPRQVEYNHMLVPTDGM